MTEGPFKRDEFLDKPGIVGARWWHEGLVHDPVGRRAALQALLVGGGLLAVGVLVTKASGCGTPDTKTVRQTSLDVQKQYGWNFGARDENLTFDGELTGTFQPGALATLASALAPARVDLRPYFVPTLLQSCTATPQTAVTNDPTPFVPLMTVVRPIFTQAMDTAFRRGKALAALFDQKVTGAAVVVDLPGPESVAFAAGAAAVFDPVFAIDNWPHPRGVVPAHLTLGAAAYYQPLFTKASARRAVDAPALFVLDRARLSSYQDENNQFDNRHLARLPPADKLAELAIRRILYVAPTVASVPELDDLNDDFVHDSAAGVVIRVVGADAFGAEPGSVGASTPFSVLAGDRDVPVFFYASTHLMPSSFWADYPWAEPSVVGAHGSTLPPAGRDYVPIARTTLFSAGLPGRTSPPAFGTVPVVVAIATGAVLGAELGRSGSWTRSYGGWGG